MKVLSPSERCHGIDAVMAARDSLCVKSVTGIGQVIRLVFTEETVVLASLREGFFNLSKIEGQSGHPIQDVISYLTCNNKKRFWDIVQYDFEEGKCERGKELLGAFAQFYIGRGQYPARFGTRLFQLICSLPPAVRRLKMGFPILDTGVCIQLSQFAKKTDYEDVPLLYDAALGRNIVSELDTCQAAGLLKIKAPDSECIVFDTVISQINEQALAQRWGIQIDSARASFVLESSTVETYEAFIDILQSFYIHLQRYVSSDPAESLDTARARSETIALLQRAFDAKGGDLTAFAQARDGIQGGLRTILDTLTEQYKAEKLAAHIERVFTDAIEALEWDERVEFMRGAMKRMGPLLSPELRSKSPEQFLRNVKPIVRMYVKSLDNVNKLLRTM
jgi:hypothetical protein